MIESYKENLILKLKKTTQTLKPLSKMLIGSLFLFIPFILFSHFINFITFLPEIWKYGNLSVKAQAIAIFLYMVLSVIYILKYYPQLVDKISLNPKKEWFNFLELSNFKIKYYKKLSTLFKIWNFVVLIPIMFSIPLFILLFLILIFVILNADLESILITPTLYKSLISDLDIQAVILDSIQTLFIFYIMIGVLGTVLWNIFLPIDKQTGAPETTDIPVTFLRGAVSELETYNLKEKWENCQEKKAIISNLIDDALEYLTLEYKIYGVPYGLRYITTLTGNIKNKDIWKDVAQRQYGLSLKIKNSLLNLNCMTESDKEASLESLNECIEILKSKNLCKIQKEEFSYETTLWGTLFSRLNPFVRLFALIR